MGTVLLLWETCASGQGKGWMETYIVSMGKNGLYEDMSPRDLLVGGCGGRETWVTRVTRVPLAIFGVSPLGGVAGCSGGGQG
jgi:hypothetical protein